MSKTNRVHVAVSRAHPLGRMNRAGVLFTMAGADYDLTDEQLAAVQADPMLVVGAKGTKAPAAEPEDQTGDELDSKNRKQLLAVGQELGLWADAPEDKDGRKAFVAKLDAGDMRAAIRTARVTAELPQVTCGGGYWPIELAAMSMDELAAFADEHGVDLGEYEDDDVTYPDVSEDPEAAAARIVAALSE